MLVVCHTRAPGRTSASFNSGPLVSEVTGIAVATPDSGTPFTYRSRTRGKVRPPISFSTRLDGCMPVTPGHVVPIRKKTVGRLLS